MKIIFLSFLISFAHASVLDQFPCKKEIATLAREWGSTNEWTKENQGGLEKFFFTTTTSQVGKWIIAKPLPDGSVISKSAQNGRTEVVFTGKDCKSTAKNYLHPRPQQGLVNDKDLTQYISKQKSGIIYYWSPRMPLSMAGIAEIKKAGDRAKLPVLILMDKNVSTSELEKLKKEIGRIETVQVDSFEFRMRSLEQHFPAIITFKNSRILPGVKYGFEKSDRYLSDINRMLGRSN